METACYQCLVQKYCQPLLTFACKCCESCNKSKALFQRLELAIKYCKPLSIGIGAPTSWPAGQNFMGPIAQKLQRKLKQRRELVRLLDDYEPVGT
jgi:hypothetical protein